jgi:hypothetical protein
LITWRCTDWPIVAGDELIQLAEHRRAYLNYQGPISDNRGHVRRVVGGDCDVTLAAASSAAAEQITIQLHEPQPMLILLRRAALDRWLVVEVG